MGMTFVWALELGRSGITVNALAPAGVTRMTESLYAGDGGEPPPTLDPALNAPLVAFLASERAGARQRPDLRAHRLRRTRCSSTPKQIAWMHRDGGWDADGGRRAVRLDARPAPPDRSAWSCPEDSPRTPPGQAPSS